MNYGKTGAIGKYQVKYIEGDGAVEKLIKSKLRKGYEPFLDFDPVALFVKYKF